MSENLPDTNVGNTEYIRKEDAKDALQEKVFHNLSDEFYGAMQVIDDLPPASVAPVVRCWHCTHYMPPHACLHDDGMITAQEDGFCSYGERKE